MNNGPIRLACANCDRTDHDGIIEIPADWRDVQDVTNLYARCESEWWTHIGDCPECWRTEAGTVELHQRWFPGGAQGNLSQEFTDGDEIFAAVMLSDGWHLSLERIVDDPDGWRFEDSLFSWADVDWFCPRGDFHFPRHDDPPEESGAEESAERGS